MTSSDMDHLKKGDILLHDASPEMGSDEMYFIKVKKIKRDKIASEDIWLINGIIIVLHAWHGETTWIECSKNGTIGMSKTELGLVNIHVNKQLMNLEFKQRVITSIFIDNIIPKISS